MRTGDLVPFVNGDTLCGVLVVEKAAIRIRLERTKYSPGA